MCETEEPKVKVLTEAAKIKKDLETAQEKWNETKGNLIEDLEILGVIAKETEITGKPTKDLAIKTGEESATPKDADEEDILVSLGKAAWKALKR
jgi:hypothetical protein